MQDCIETIYKQTVIHWICIIEDNVMLMMPMLHSSNASIYCHQIQFTLEFGHSWKVEVCQSARGAWSLGA